MGYRNLKECVDDLERSGKLIRITEEVDPHLELAEIHRRVWSNKGPALLFTNVKNTRFPLVSNLFGTLERTEFIFRDAIQVVRALIQLKVDPAEIKKNPALLLKVIPGAWHTLPRFKKNGPIFKNKISVADLPKIVSWPKDGGAFVTLPQVYTEDPRQPGIPKSNLGMYRVQLDGNDYGPNEVGLHYQIHRGIGVHQTAALQKGEELNVRVVIGGPPALTIAAVMPLPEGLPELFFAGALSGQRISYVRDSAKLPIPAEADFVISGTIGNALKPEGPFGDHLGYYSLTHDFPVMKVNTVWQRPNAIWPFTVVGRPPQEDTSFGKFIHELTGPVIPTVVPGVKAVNAVDAAGVHPLMLAIGSERYTPYSTPEQPMELLTQANGILGQGQMSLAKYLMIVNGQDNPSLNIEDIPSFFHHLLERINWSRDLHFQTSTTMDTLDYSGTALNQGSKVVLAAAGPPIRKLPKEVPERLRLPESFDKPHVALPGVLVVEAPPWEHANTALKAFSQSFTDEEPINQFPLIVLADDSDFTSRNLNNFLWVAFTRSNPAHDIDGIESFIENKHWGCRGSLVIDARIKEHHAPLLESNSAVSQRVDELSKPGGPLYRII